MTSPTIEGVAKNYYTYLLIDPRNGKPFYVGKGKGRRCTQHIAEARTTNKNSHKLQKIRKIESMGLDVVVKQVDTDLSEADAFELEEFLIQEIGRSDKGIGLLTNRTDGGEGASGAIRSEEMKQKLSDFVKQNNPMHRDDVRVKTSGGNHWNFGKPAANIGTKWTDEQRAAQSEKFSGDNHPMFGKPCSEERKAAIKAGTKGIKKSTTINMRKPKRKEQCIHCGTFASGGNLARWHNDNCKENK